MTRPCNSERYFLGRGFRGIIPECLAALRKIEEQSRFLRYPVLDKNLEFEEEFLNRHIDTSITQQVKYIESAITISKSSDLWWSRWISLSIAQSSLWCETFHVNAHPRRSYLKIINDKYEHINLINY
jgi:hypothetical protein